MLKYIPFPLLIILLAFSSCANKVTWNKADGKALLIDYGYHSSLILQDQDGIYWEYTYGDWEWFAMNRSQWWRLPVTLFWPTTLALGRGEYSEKKFLEMHLDQFITKRYVFEVDPRKVQALIERLNEKFEIMKNSRRDYYQHLYRLNFVPLPSENYHVFHNCNHVLINWLEQLGLKVSGVGLFSKWEFEVNRP